MSHARGAVALAPCTAPDELSLLLSSAAHGRYSPYIATASSQNPPMYLIHSPPATPFCVLYRRCMYNRVRNSTSTHH
ncbi:hypothetical protein HYPSUDRAFT_447221 [Hypholoma sublateritium FD-334 SS-4]|uniref:Uncharacterized protein n=1 Tax=Hypholoma sublateritium (strain FD-334 SS-4) TaxID=945553 RepID=A0A0D2NCN2_HYPSF|nr:hypothetical protein HYPSUDRAFT_447221 [Hypholoma sublateritium FD-334 SS-4]